eukprot:sb/3476317/
MRRENFMIEILKIVVRLRCKYCPIIPELYYLETSPTYRNGAKDVRNTVGPFILSQTISFLKKSLLANIYLYCSYGVTAQIFMGHPNISNHISLCSTEREWLKSNLISKIIPVPGTYTG